VGDLEIRLISPSGKSITLRDHIGGAADDLEQRFGRGGASVKELEDLARTDMRGEWQLVIKDTMAQDAGVLEVVELAIRHW
jgi:subtilisin-like proprotein convertase family protein